MRHLKFSTKVALWSAIVVSAALLIFGIVVSVAVRHSEMALLDGRLRGEVEHYLKEFRLHDQSLRWVTQPEFEEIVTAAREPHLYSEVATSDGRTLVLTRSLRGGTLSGAPDGYGWVTVHGMKMRTYASSTGGITMRIASDLADIQKSTAALREALVIALPIALACVAGGAWLIARRTLAPVQAMAAAAARITAERFDKRLPVLPVQDEIGSLARSFNEMIDRLETSFRQAIRFSADASHELKTPLAVARAGLGELLRSRELRPQDQQSVAEVLDQIGRLTTIMDSLLLLSRVDAGRMQLAAEPTDISALIAAQMEDVWLMAGDREIEIDADIAPHLHACAEPWCLRQIVINLIDNALKYNVAGGTVRMALSAEDAAVTLRVGNSGPGIPPETRERIFERFFRGEHSSGTRGTGLGLSIARELARAQGAELTLSVARAGWTEFSLALRPCPDAANVALPDPVGV